jgi:hypothetical protein
MRERQRGRVERVSSGRQIGGRSAVEGVAQYRVADVREVRADLVRDARAHRRLDERAFAGHGDQREGGLGRPRAPVGGRAGHAAAVLRVVGEGKLERAAVERVGPAGDHGEVALLDRARA